MRCIRFEAASHFVRRRVVPALICSLWLSAASGHVGAVDEPSTPRAPIYDEQADASQQIQEAIAKARQDNRRVLIQWGGNWCGWCYKLHDVFKKEPEIARLLQYEYVVVPVDVGNFDKNTDLTSKLGANLREHGVPFLTVLDGQGKPLVNQDTGSLEEGDHHDVAKVKSFLEKYKSPPVNANAALQAALAQAKNQDKQVLVHLGAPWCGWCHRLEDFLAAHRETFEKDFVLLKIDTDRMEEGRETAAKLRKTPGGGIPWMVVLDASGKEVVNSDAETGNVGYPVTEGEIAHFVKMLKLSCRKLGESDIAAIRQDLEKRAEKYRR